VTKKTQQPGQITGEKKRISGVGFLPRALLQDTGSQPQGERGGGGKREKSRHKIKRGSTGNFKKTET